MQDYKRKLAAIFSADVAGYSRLMGEDEAATVKTLTAYREVMYSLIKQHRGRVVDSPGDNLLAEFASVVDAAQCGVAVQKEIQSRNSSLPEERRMYFRIGINLGDVIEEGDRIYGDGVNIAARLESLADPGGICISKTAFDHIESKLPLGYEFIGEQTVKNISKPVYAYKVIMDPRVFTVGRIKKAIKKSFWTPRNIAITGITAVALIIIFSVLGVIPRCSDSQPAKSNDPRPSIVVLPFKNMSGDPNQEPFSDGITEELIHSLARIEGLRVVSRTSSFYYKGKSVSLPTIGNELGVNHVLEGSVRKDENNLRITAQLISVADDTHLLSLTYDREMKDIFIVQEEISKAVAEKLKIKLLGTEYESEKAPSIVQHERRMGFKVAIDDDEIITGGLLATGVNIDIAGSVKGGLKAVGANVDISGISQDEVDFFAMNAILSGNFQDKVKGTAEKITVSGIFEKDLEVDAKHITLSPTAVINGDFRYSGVLDRKDGSQINGEITETKKVEPVSFSLPKEVKEKSIILILLSKLYGFLTTLTLGFFMKYLIPKQNDKVITTMSSTPVLKSLKRGLLFSIAAPFIMLFSFISLVGVFFGIVFTSIIIVVYFMGIVYSTVWFGKKILSIFKASFSNNFIFSLITGFIVIEAASFIPFADFILKLLLLLIGVGVIWQLTWSAIKTARDEAIGKHVDTSPSI